MNNNNKFFVLFLSLFVLEILAQNAPPVQLSLDQVFLSSVGKNDATNFIFAVSSPPQDVSVTVFPIEPQPPSILEGNITFCVGSASGTNDLGCSNSSGTYDESLIVQVGVSPNLYIAVNTDSPSPIQFTISISAVLDALSVDYQNTTGKYQFYGTITSGIRRYYSYNPGPGDQQIQLEICNSEDFSGNNNAVSANFLFNRFSDHWVEYNQTLADNPCGDPTVHGNVKVLDPSSDSNNSMFKICPSYVVTAGPLNVYFSIDVLNFWGFPQLNGTITYRISIDTTYNTFLPLTQTDAGYDYIYVAEFILEQSGNDAIVSFQPVAAVAGPPPTDMQYALFTDYSSSAQVKQYLVVNTSMSSSCYLLAHESSMMVGSWLAASSLVAGTGSLVSFTATDFYKNYNQGTFHVNLVANSPSRGSFAYTFQTIDYSTSSGGLGGWAITFIVLGSIVGAVAILLVLGVIGYFAFMKYQNRSKYELL